MQVELPDGNIGEFPDDMPDDKIEALIRQEYPQKSQNNKGEDFLKSIARDIRESAKKGLGDIGRKTAGKTMGGVGESLGYGAVPAIEQLPSGLKEGAKTAYAGLTGQEQPEFEPAGDEYGAGAGKMIGHFLGQSAVASPLAGLAATGAGAAGISPLIAGLGGQAAGMAATTPGGAGRRSLAAAETLAIPAAGKGIKVAGKMAGKGAQNLIESVGRFRNSKNVDPLEDEYNNAEQVLQAITERLNAEKKLSQESFGKTSPESMQRQINQDKSRINQLGQDINEIPKEPMDTSLPPPNYKENVARASIDVEDSASNLDKAKSSVSQYLDEFLEHDRRAGEKILDKYKQKKADISKSYNALKGEMSKIPLVDEPKRDKLLKELPHLIDKNEYTDPESRELVQKIVELQKNKGNAHDYLEAYRDTRDLANDTLLKGFDEDLPRAQQLENQEAGKKLQSHANKMYESLKKQLPDDVKKRLEETQSRWKNEIAPLYRNKFFNKVKFSETTPKDAFQKLKGSDSGNDIIKDIIKSDPEILKLTMGERYASKPQDLLKTKETEQAYIDLHPEMKQLQDNLRQAHSSHGEAKQNYETTKKQADTFAEQLKNIDKRASTQKKREALISERANMLDALPEMEQQVYRLKTRLKEKDLSVKKRDEIKEKLNKAQKDLEYAQGVKKGAAVTGGGALSAIVGYKGLKGLAELMADKD